ncbi:MAG: tRNA (adenosine(37)-N6)-dimethylallyltransferase MiaA [Thermodesulfobacteriota bacterium]
MEKPRIVVIAGPTAVGKSRLAVELAGEFSGEVVSADSMQVFRLMDIGTAKPAPVDMRGVPHHLMDIVDPDGEYTAADFRRDASRKIAEITARGGSAFVVGGTGLYVRALTEGLAPAPEADRRIREELLRQARVEGPEAVHGRLAGVDPAAAAAIHPNNLRRVIRAIEVFEITRTPISDLHRAHAFGERPFDTLKIGLMMEREVLYEAIERRVDGMISAGLIEEVRALLAGGFRSDLKPMRGLGYKEITAFIEGRSTLAEAAGLIKRNTRRYAKRQLTWFRKDKEIKWFSPEDTDAIRRTVAAHLCLRAGGPS